VEISGSQVFMRQQEYQEFVLDSSAVEEVREKVLLSGAGEPTAMVIGYTGVRFLLIHLPDESRLPEVEVSQEALYRFSETHDLVGMYVFAEKERPPGGSDSAQHAPRNGKGADGEGQDEQVSRPVISARMFAPYYGIEEESATGMAAGPAAHYLVSREYVRAARFTVEQGRYMPEPSPSVIHAWFSPGDPQGRVRIGGGAYLESERSVSV
jgi:PhzF family phenazine biosynthesis protein